VLRWRCRREIFTKRVRARRVGGWTAHVLEQEAGGPPDPAASPQLLSGRCRNGAALEKDFLA